MNDFPIDPIDFILREKWLTVTVIGSIFTYNMVNKFRESIFDPMVVYVLPPESFEFMNIDLKEIFPYPNNKEKLTLKIGDFFRETILWFFIILFLYILNVLLKFPAMKGGSSGAAIL